jgi:hypothetical protein
MQVRQRAVILCRIPPPALCASKRSEVNDEVPPSCFANNCWCVRRGLSLRAGATGPGTVCNPNQSSTHGAAGGQRARYSRLTNHTHSPRLPTREACSCAGRSIACAVHAYTKLRGSFDHTGYKSPGHSGPAKHNANPIVVARIRSTTLAPRHHAGASNYCAFARQRNAGHRHPAPLTINRSHT